MVTRKGVMGRTRRRSLAALTALLAVSVLSAVLFVDTAEAAAVLKCNNRVVTVKISAGQKPTNGADVIWGTQGADVINGLGGDDVICGRGGRDSINGQGGHDWIDGGDGADTIFGGSWGDDTIYGGKGADIIWGRNGNDKLYGQGGGDKIYGEAGHDQIWGSYGNDTIWGGDGNDKLYGEGANDTINGGNGADFINGGDGNDSLAGGYGTDQIYGHTGWDSANGGAGADICDAESMSNCENPQWAPGAALTVDRVTPYSVYISWGGFSNARYVDITARDRSGQVVINKTVNASDRQSRLWQFGPNAVIPELDEIYTISAVLRDSNFTSTSPARTATATMPTSVISVSMDADPASGQMSASRSRGRTGGFAFKCQDRILTIKFGVDKDDPVYFGRYERHYEVCFNGSDQVASFDDTKSGICRAENTNPRARRFAVSKQGSIQVVDGGYNQDSVTIRAGCEVKGEVLRTFWDGIRVESFADIKITLVNGIPHGEIVRKKTKANDL